VRWSWRVLAAVVTVSLAACGSNRTTQELLDAEAPRGALAAGTDAGADTGASADATGEGGIGAAGTGGAAGAAGAGAARTATTVAGGPAAATCRRPCPEIVIGSVGTDSGPLGAALAPMAHAVRAWEADVNARGGLNGHRVRLITADDGGDPGRALANVRRLVEESGVVAFVGTRGILTEHAYAPYLAEKGVPVIAPCGCSSAYDSSPMLFPLAPGGVIGGAWAQVGGLVTVSDIRDISVFYCREAPICHQSRDGIIGEAAGLGIRVRHEAQISIAAPDFTAEVIAARNAGAQAVVVSTENATAIRILRSMRRQNWNAPLVIQMSAHDQRFVSDGGDLVEGTMVTGGVIPYRTPRLAGYRTALARYVPGGVLADFGAQAWLGGQLLERIAPRFGDRVTSQTILDGLYSLSNETLDGAIAPSTWRRGTHEFTNLCVVSLVVRNGAFTAPKGDGFACHPNRRRS
jgi:branched-chain amino acid transport system substrate-binding protein